MDVISIGGLVLGIVSSIAIFIKGIRKCKCTGRGLTLERESKDDLQKQQDFTIKLIKLLQTYPASGQEYTDNISEKGQSTGGLSEISEEIAPEIKDQMIRMLQILSEDVSTSSQNKNRKKMVMSILRPMKRRDQTTRDRIRKEIENEIREKMKSDSCNRVNNENVIGRNENVIGRNTQTPLYKNSKNTNHTKNPKITQFIATRK